MKQNIKALLVTSLAVVAAPASAQDWAGAYGGATASRHSGTGTDYLDGNVFDGGYTNPFDRTGNMLGVFAGYRWQNGNIVFGPEISASFGAIRMDGVPENKVTDTQSIQVKVGYATDRALFSVGLGYAAANVDPRCVVECGSASLSGRTISVGVDYLVTDKIFLGASVTNKSFGKGTYEILSPVWELDGDDTALELRVGYNF